MSEEQPFKIRKLDSCQIIKKHGKEQGVHVWECEAEQPQMAHMGNVKLRMAIAGNKMKSKQASEVAGVALGARFSITDPTEQTKALLKERGLKLSELEDALTDNLRRGLEGMECDVAIGKLKHPDPEADAGKMAFLCRK